MNRVTLMVYALLIGLTTYGVGYFIGHGDAHQHINQVENKLSDQIKRNAKLELDVQSANLQGEIKYLQALQRHVSEISSIPRQPDATGEFLKQIQMKIVQRCESKADDKNVAVCGGWQLVKEGS